MEKLKILGPESLRAELDRIDRECIEYASDRYYNSRLKMLVGMWDKGLIVAAYRGVDAAISYSELGRITGRNREDLKKWHDLYKKHPDKEKYIKTYAEPRALTWTQRALESAKEANKTVHVSHNSGENEWYTPSYIIESARSVMGSIDLDPATSALANETVKAAQIFTASDNGLEHKWHGNVWIDRSLGR